MTLLHSSSGRPYCSTDAKVQVVLPQLTEIRLVALTKQLSRNRKQLYLTQGNNVADLHHYGHYVDREQKLSLDRHRHVSAPFNKSLSHIKGVQQCLKRRKSETLLEHGPVHKFGIYNGLSVKSLKGEIEKILKENDYQHVKMRKAKQLLADGKADGRVMNIKMCVPMLDSILKRPSMPMRREKALWFELSDQDKDDAADDDDDDDDNETDERRPKRTVFHLPPVTATRLYSPSKSKRSSGSEKRMTLDFERSKTIA